MTVPTAKPFDTAKPLPAPALIAPFPKHSGPGYVEIKPHNRKGITDGLVQLRELKFNRPAIPENKEKGTRFKPFRPAKSGEPFLLTYHLKAKPGQKASEVTGYVLRPDKRYWQNGVLPGDRDPQMWVDALGTWSLLGKFTVPETDFGTWGWQAGPPAAGSMLEHPLREAFVKLHQVPGGSHTTVNKRASDPGVDIDFRELAEFFYELDAALGRAA